MDFQRNQSWKRERMRKTGNRICRVMGTEQALLTIRRNPMVPLGCQNFTIKGGVGYEEKTEIFREKELSVKFCKRKGNWGKS